MPGRVSEHLIQQILDRVNLVELIGAQVKLKRAGRNFVGLCPFHTDAKPSFSVSPDKGLYHCFGCHESGNAITYMTRSRGLGYLEALEVLAGMAGMELVFSDDDGYSRKAARDTKRQLYDIQKEANSWFRMCLTAPEGEPYRTYLASRGITSDDISSFQIGCSPNASGLHEHLTRRGLLLNMAEQAGLLVRKSPTSAPIDRFRHRITFPIITPAGDIAGFSGRTIAADGIPKYLNSPESEVFTKGELLFGLVQAREAIKKRGFCVLVEGQVDCLTLHANGWNNAVAPLGTALTDAQCILLKRFTDSVVLMYDGDEAGRKASWRSMSLLMSHGLFGKVVVLPDREDPDSFLRKTGGKDLLAEKIDRARPFLEHATGVLQGLGRQTLHGRARAAQAGLELAALLPGGLERDVFLDRLSSDLAIPRERLRSVASEKKTESPTLPSHITVSIPKFEKRILDVLLSAPELVRQAAADDVFDMLTSALVKQVVVGMLTAMEETGSVSTTDLLESLDEPAFRDICADSLLMEHPWTRENAAAVLAEAVAGLDETRHQAMIKALRARRDDARARGDIEEETRLAAELHELSRQRTEQKRSKGVASGVLHQGGIEG